MDVVGVDGCPKGWFAVRLFDEGKFEVRACESFAHLLDHFADVDMILVDIPIGLPENAKPRDCDTLARTLVGSSVFRTPTRQTAAHVREFPNDFAGACASEREHAKTPKGMSKQAFNITGKIAEVDAILLSRPKDSRPIVREIHPEVCFYYFNGEKRLNGAKKSSGKRGYRERLNLLEPHEPCAAAIADAARAKYLVKQVGWDDIAVAMVAAVTANHPQSALRTLPQHPTLSPQGLPMEMVYWVPPTRW